MDDDSREGATERLVAYLAAGSMTLMLVVMTWGYNREVVRANAATASANSWIYASAQRNQEIEALIAERDYLAGRLVEALSEDRVQIVSKPCMEADPTPVFSRDSQFIGTHR